MSHSPEPWSVGPIEGHSAGHIGRYRLLTASDGRLIGHLWPDSDADCDANAERIVACVNACRGIPTEVLADCDKHGGLNSAYGLDQLTNCCLPMPKQGHQGTLVQNPDGTIAVKTAGGKP